MEKGNTVLTLKNTNERIDSLEKKIDKILQAFGNDGKVLSSNEKKLFEMNVKTLIGDCDNQEQFLNLVNYNSKEFVDENNNVFVKLPTIWLKLNDSQLMLSFTEIGNNDYTKLEPQAISKYKNSWSEGKIRSIPNIAPDCNQFSYNKSKKLCAWANGEMLNWKTILYIQIIWLFAYGTKENDSIIPNENYNWNTERDCGFADTGNGIGEFLGVEQLFTSGRNLFSFDGWNNDIDLFSLFKKFSNLSVTECDDKFGLWGDYNQDSNSKAAFFCIWVDGVYRAWDDYDGALRLCKSPSEEGC